MKKQVLIAAPISSSFEQFLCNQNFDLITTVHDASQIEGIVTSNKLKLFEPELKSYPQLKWIARLGSGMEIVDTQYCDLHEIRYFNSPKGIANSVAEHTTGMILSLLHKIQSSHREVTENKWIREANRGQEIEQLTLGIIGYGHTGSAFAKKMTAFCHKIVAYDKYKSGFGNDDIGEASLEAVLQQADILSFHVPLNAETTHYYNEDFLNRLSKPHYLINVSRGAVCDTKVILSGLESGKLLGACLDVLEE